MKEQLITLIKEAMKSKDEVKLRVLRLIKTEFMKFETAKDAKELTADAEIQVLKGMVKQRNQSIEAYVKNNRTDLAEKEQEEIAVIETFLPKMVSTDELTATIKELIVSNNVVDSKGIGKVMGALKTKYGASFDASVAGKLIKEQIA